MVKKVAVLTATRAEFGLLYWTIKAIEEDPDLLLQLIVTGSHMSHEFGSTYCYIETEGFQITEKIDMLLSSDSRQGAAKSMGVLIISLAQVFERLKPDILLLLGDRYEILAAASAAVAMNIPIAHLCGGESTEGAIDEQVRHAVTKLSHIHFAQTEFYRQRIIKMGEEEWRVHNVGPLGLENIKKLPLLNKEELEQKLKISLDGTVLLVTYHPVTLGNEPQEKQIDNLLAALDRFDAHIIFTYPNADSGSRQIIEKINDFKLSRPNVHVFLSLGQLNYLSLMKCSDAMVGNSSSGILESPFFCLPVVNIGDRQKGRLRCRNVIDVPCSEEKIAGGIKKVLTREFRDSFKNDVNLYDNGECSRKIVDILKEMLLNSELMKKKLSFKE
jgi:GDP/UDP-N,N'-diacetylbacillosamine 2-epimerase (hydrolysing)